MNEDHSTAFESFTARPRFVAWEEEDGTCYAHFVGEWPQEVDREGARRLLDLISKAVDLADSGLFGKPELAEWFIAERIAKALVVESDIDLNLNLDGGD